MTPKKGNNRLLDPEKEIFLTGLAESIADFHFPEVVPVQPVMMCFRTCWKETTGQASTAS